jgi:hypothetical protein
VAKSTVVAEEISQGRDVVVVDDNLEVVEGCTGDIIIDNEVVTIEEGTITEVAPEVKLLTRLKWQRKTK